MNTLLILGTCMLGLVFTGGLLFFFYALGAAAASGDYARHEATKVAAAEKWAKRMGEK